MFPVVAKQS